MWHAATTANIDLRNGLRADRQFMLPGEPGDVDRHLLSGRTDAERPEQKPMPEDRHRSDHAAFVLRSREDSNRGRPMLCAVACHDRRRLLRRAGRSQSPRELRKADTAGRMRNRLYENAGWIVLQ
jgi:hypothetical protein